VTGKLSTFERRIEILFFIISSKKLLCPNYQKSIPYIKTRYITILPF